MNSNRTIFRKNATILIVAFFTVYGAMAQKPEITTVDNVNGSMTELVTLKGSSFGTDATKLAVFFGAQKATIQSVSNQLLEVAIPPGTTYDNISVTNTTAGLTGYSRNQFLLSFSGKHPFDLSNLGPELDFAANDELYDHCLCDLNLDGKVDIATANKSSTSISILQNTSTGTGNINFNTTQFPIGAASLQIKCGDLNSDGRPDLIVTEGTAGINDRVFILQNTGAFTFSTQSIKLTGRKNSKIEIADLDLNGKPEIIITDQGSNNVSILVNQSAGAIAFAAAPLNLTIPDAATTDGIALEDLNGDDRPDLVTSQFGTSNSNLYIAPNTSIPGTVSFGAVSMIAIDKTVRDIRIGDLDHDRKPDIAVTQFLGASISILLNTTTASAITFGSPTAIAVDAAPWGLDVGDIDGDGLTDIAVASIASTNVTLLNNQSTPGNLSFLKQSAATTFITRHVRIGDLDGDGKPDISFCSVDKAGVPASKVSVFRNETCVIPKLSPSETPLSLCTGTLPYKLTATMSRGASYQWLKDGAPISCGVDQNTLDVTTGTGSGIYTVKILAEGGTCSSAGSCEEESEGIDITIGAGAAVTVLPTNNGPVCIGSTLSLGVTNNTGTSYKWTGPANFTGTGPSPTRSDFKLEYAGTYTVEVTAGGCIASRESTVVEAIDAPTFQVGYSGSTVICQGDAAKVLSVVPNLGTYTYQWLKDGTPIASATNATYSVTSVPASTGSYAVRASYSGCSTFETTPVEIRIATLPSAIFSVQSTACAGQKVLFDNQSTADNTATVFYEWNFDDGQTSTAEEPEHIFSAANTYDVVLTVSYKDGACPSTVMHSINITPASAVSITNPENDYLMCEGEELALEVVGTFDAYAWSTGETVPSIIITQSGTYTVDVKDPNGCVLTASRVVNGLPAPGVIVTATPQQINEGESSQLLASGLQNYEWTPPDALSSATIANPVATPLVTTTYTVTGEDTNGCTGIATIEVSVKGDAIVNKLDPKNFFSPNNSGPNDLWTVDHILEYPQCTVTIYDDKGVKVFNAKPYQNDWNGLYNGKPLPDGVYFYIIRCDGEENSPRTGSITLIR